MSDESTAAGATHDTGGGRWRVRQDALFRFQVEGPGAQRYAPHAVKGLPVPEVRRLHDALKDYSPAPEARVRQARLLDVLADAAAHPMGLDQL